MFSFSEKSLERLSTCDDRLQKIANLAIKISTVDFGISCGHRSIEEQQKLYAQGRTAPGKIVTYVDGVNRMSMHNYNPSRAFDVYAYVNGKARWAKSYYYAIADAVKQAADTFDIEIEWGGDWTSFHDLPHFELK